LNRAEVLLFRLIDATEVEARQPLGRRALVLRTVGHCLRKHKQPTAELLILERYERLQKAPGVGPSKLATRLARLRSKIPQAGD
jgi:hypothetical protein